MAHFSKYLFPLFICICFFSCRISEVGTSPTVQNSAAASPVVLTGEASDITGYYAVMNAQINPRGNKTVYYFQYTTDSTSLMNWTNSQTLGGLFETFNVSGEAVRLEANTHYYFRVIARNDSGTTYGHFRSFTTAPPAVPIIKAETPLYIGVDSAIISATVNPNGASTNCFFVWGLTSSSGEAYSDDFMLPSSNTPQKISYVLKNLLPNTTYYYYVFASNDKGYLHSDTLYFTTKTGQMADYFQHFTVGSTSLWDFNQDDRSSYPGIITKGWIKWTVTSIDNENGITRTTISRVFTGYRIDYTKNISKPDSVYYEADYSTATITEDADHNITLDLDGQGGKFPFKCGKPVFNRFQLDKGENISLQTPGSSLYLSFSKKYGFTSYNQYRLGMSGISTSYSRIIQ